MDIGNPESLPLAPNINGLRRPTFAVPHLSLGISVFFPDLGDIGRITDDISGQVLQFQMGVILPFDYDGKYSLTAQMNSGRAGKAQLMGLGAQFRFSIDIGTVRCFTAVGGRLNQYSLDGELIVDLSASTIVWQLGVFAVRDVIDVTVEIPIAPTEQSIEFEGQTFTVSPAGIGIGLNVSF